MRPSSGLRASQQSNNMKTKNAHASNIKIKGVSNDTRHNHNQSVAIAGKFNMSSIDNLTEASKKALALHQKNQSINNTRATAG